LPWSCKISLFDPARWLKRAGRWAFDNHPKQRTISWPALCASLTRFREFREKPRTPCWSPTVYPYDTIRRKANVIAVTCLVLDYDDGTPISAIHEAWESWPHIVHTSWSHKASEPKARLVVPLEEPIPAEHWGRVWHWAQARVGYTADTKCCDASRLYFVPATPIGGNRDAYAAVHDDAAHMLRLIPHALPMTPQEREAQQRAARPKPRPRLKQDKFADANRLKTDAGARERLGIALGGRLENDTIQRIKCPSCNRRAVWYPLDPHTTVKALCSHINSCGWTGFLDQLAYQLGKPI